MTPNEIQTKRFDKGMSGYKTDEVNAYLIEVAAYVRELEGERDELERKMVVLAEKLEEYREDEDSLRAALIGAQKLGDSVVRDAKKKAEQILFEANAKAEELVADTRANMDKESLTLSKMQSEVVAFRAKILDMYKRHIETIKGIPETNEPVVAVRETIRHSSKKQAAAASPEAAEAVKEEKVSEFVLNYEEEPDAQESDGPAPKHKRQSYGNLRFGEEYNLTRKE